MSAPPEASSALLGYQMVGRPTAIEPRPAAFRPVARQAWQESPLPYASVAGRHLRPHLAVVLAGDVLPGMSPGAVFLALAGCCLAIEMVDGAGVVAGTVVGERLLEPEATGSVTLTGPRGLSTTAPAPLGDVVAQIGWLASATAGLPAGRMVFPIPRRPAEPLPATPGVWQVDGPNGATLTVTVTP